MRLILLAVAVTVFVPGLAAAQGARRKAAVEQEVRWRLVARHASVICQK